MKEMFTALTNYINKSQEKEPSELERYGLFAETIAIHGAKVVTARIKGNQIDRIPHPSGDLLELFNYDTEYRARTGIGLITHNQIFGTFYRMVPEAGGEIITTHDYPTILRHIAIADHRFGYLKRAFPRMVILSPIDGLPANKQREIREVIKNKRIKHW